MSAAQRIAGAWLLALSLTACGTLLPAKPETPAEGLAQTYAAITALADTTTALVQAGTIDAEQAVKISAALNGAADLADAARTVLAAGDDARALAYIQAAAQVLDAVQELLGRLRG